jgi:isoamylase
VALRDQQKRNFMATLLLSLGVPMLLAGDEFGHSQGGNNNAYCQDNDITWLNWETIRPEDEALRTFVRFLIRFRRQHRVFSRPRFFRGEVVSEAGLKDITWVTPAGVDATDEDWGNHVALSLGYVLDGAAGEFFTTGGQRDIDESFLVMMNAYYGDLDFHFPQLPAPLVWEALVDTAEPTGLAKGGRLWLPGESYNLRAHSFALFINRAPAPQPLREVEAEGTTDFGGFDDDRPWDGDASPA